MTDLISELYKSQTRTLLFYTGLTSYSTTTTTTPFLLNFLPSPKEIPKYRKKMYVIYRQHFLRVKDFSSITILKCQKSYTPCYKYLFKTHLLIERRFKVYKLSKRNL